MDESNGLAIRGSGLVVGDVEEPGSIYLRGSRGGISLLIAVYDGSVEKIGVFDRQERSGIATNIHI